MNPTEEEDLRAQLEKAKEFNLRLKTHLDEAYEHLNSNQEQVDDYREQLSELSRDQDDVSEDSIAKSFQGIFDGIEFWIDEFSSKPGFDEYFANQFTERLRDAKAERTLLNMTNGARIDWVKVGRSHNCCYIVLSLIIGDFLERHVLRVPEASKYGHIYPFELRSEHMKVLSEVQEKMMIQSPENDIRASRWRSEAVTALMARRIEDSRLQAPIHDQISLWIGQPLSAEQKGSLQTKVLDRALRALQSIGGSSKEYVFLGSKNKPGQYDSNASEWKAKDIYTWNTVSRHSATGGILKFLYPGLSRRKDSRGPGIPLVSPTLLVETPKSRTPSPRKSGVKTPTRRSSMPKDSQSHVERSRAPMPTMDSKEKTAATKGIPSGDLFRGLVATRTVKDMFGSRSRDKKPKTVKQEETGVSTRPPTTFPNARHHSRSHTSSGGRRRRDETELEAEMTHGRDVYLQQDHGEQVYPTTNRMDESVENGVPKESYSRDRATWNVNEDLSQDVLARDRHSSSYSHSQ